MKEEKSKKKLRIKLPEKYTEKVVLKDYLNAANIDSWDMMFRVGELSAAIKSVFPMDGGDTLRKTCLTYFFAGVHFARTHKEDEYIYTHEAVKKKDMGEKKDGTESKVSDYSDNYFG
jgi:hypothetical protein